MAADGSGPRGSRFGGSSAMSSDCVFVGWEIYVFATASDAHAQFEDWVRSAPEVISESASPDNTQTAIIRVASSHEYQIISAQSASELIHVIRSRSLEHALLYARQEKNGAGGSKKGVSLN